MILGLLISLINPSRLELSYVVLPSSHIFVVVLFIEPILSENHFNRYQFNVCELFIKIIFGKFRVFEYLYVNSNFY